MNIEGIVSRKEEIASKVHDAWWAEKKKQGFHPPIKCKKFKEVNLSKPFKFAKCCKKCHSDMYSYEELPEHVKDYDRVTTQVVLDAIKGILAEEQLKIEE